MKAKPKQEQDPKIWEIRGLKLKLDATDLDTAERLDAAFEKMGAAEMEIPKDGKYADIIRGYLHMYEVLFREIFPEDADRLLAAIPKSTDAYDEVYISLLGFIAAQRAASVQRRMERLSKYRPAGRKK